MRIYLIQSLAAQLTVEHPALPATPGPVHHGKGNAD